MTDIARALVEALSPADLARLAERLAPYLAAPVAVEDGWLDTKGAAEYLGLSVHALHKLTAARVVPFEQERANGKCWFERSELDAYRRGLRAAA